MKYDLTRDPEVATDVQPEAMETGDTLAFDEAAFLKKTRRKSVLRSLITAIGVTAMTLVLLAAGLIGLEVAGQKQARRIGDYYPILTTVTTPGTYLIEAEHSDTWGLQSRSVQYRVFRMVGNTPVDVGTRRVEFGVWGGEQMGGYAAAVSVGERQILSGGLPELRFVYPEGEVEPACADEARLAALPASATVEIAVSFDSVVSRDEMLARLPRGTRAMWGAIRTAEPGNTMFNEPMAGNMLGLPLADDLFYDGDVSYPESELVEMLGNIAQYAPDGTAQNVRDTANYLAANGIAYYGVVVVGEPAALLELANRDDVRFVSLGAVLMPWEVLPAPSQTNATTE